MLEADNEELCTSMACMIFTGACPVLRLNPSSLNDLLSQLGASGNTTTSIRLFHSI
jgi:hypothetical protein